MDLGYIGMIPFLSTVKNDNPRVNQLPFRTGARVAESDPQLNKRQYIGPTDCSVTMESCLPMSHFDSCY